MKNQYNIMVIAVYITCIKSSNEFIISGSKKPTNLLTLVYMSGLINCLGKFYMFEHFYFLCGTSYAVYVSVK